MQRRKEFRHPVLHKKPNYIKISSFDKYRLIQFYIKMRPLLKFLEARVCV